MRKGLLHVDLEVCAVVCALLAFTCPVSAETYDNNGQVVMQWVANTDPDLEGYNLYRATQSGGPYTKINTSLITTNTYTDTDTVDGTTYYYVVTAVDHVGNESGYSPESEGCCVDMTAPTVTASPAGGHFFEAQSVTLSSSEEGTIHFTTDGATPTTSSPAYSTALSLSDDTTLKFIGIDLAQNTSSVQTEDYTFAQPEDDTDGDGMPDLYEVENGFDPLDDSDAQQDADGDGFSNLAEYQQGSDPNDIDDYPTPPWAVSEMLRPHAGQGLTADTLRVPVDTSVMVALEDEESIDPASIDLTMNAEVVAYTVHEVTPGDMRQVWVIYDSLGSFAYDEQVNVTVEASDVNGYTMTPYAYSFKIETSDEHDAALAAAPATTTVVDDPSAGLTTIYGEEGTELEGLAITCANDETVPPRLGPSSEIDPMADPATLDILLNIEPTSYYETPVTVIAPVSQALDISFVAIYYFNPSEGWVQAAEGDGWLVSGSRVEDAVNELLEFQIMYAAPVQFLDESPPLEEFALTVNVVGSGTVDQDPDAPYYDGDTVMLTAVPDAGWSFVDWSGDATGGVNPASVAMDADKTITATFTQNEYTVTVNVVGSGTVDLNPAGPYHSGDVVTLTAAPDAGWSFVDWSGDATGDINPASVTMGGDKTVTATFKEEDSTPPTDPVIGTPAQVVNAAAFAVVLAAPSTDANFSGYQVLGGQYADWTNTAETGPFLFTLVQDAENTLSIRGQDTYGNVSNAASVVITEDSVLPTEPVIEAASDVTDADSVTVTVVAPSTDAHFSNYQIRGGQYAGWTNTAETASFEFTLSQDVENTLQVRGMDAAGNAGPSAAVVVVEDSSAPTEPALAVASQAVNADDFTVGLTTPSADANFECYQLRGAQYGDWTDTVDTDNFVFNLAQNAENVLEVRGKDTLGHIGLAASVTITEDSIPPSAPGQPQHAN
jgi:hypothetical protein